MRPSRFARALAVALVAATPALAAPPRPAPAPAPAEEAPADRAAKLRDQANDAMLGMRYADALALYKEALQLAPDQIGLRYSIARAHQFLGEFPEALASLETFAQDAPPDTKARVGKLDELFAQLRPRVATLDVKCNVPGARVLVRGTIAGATPLAPMRVNAGAATLAIELEGFFTETRDVVLPGGGALSLDVVLHKKSTDGLVSVRTEPMGAELAVDGRAVGTSNPKIELALPAGPHELVARRDGYDTARVPIVLAPGAARDLAIPLEKSVPITGKWWFWTGVGVVVLGGVATAIALTTERSAGHGTLAPGQVGAP